MIIKMKHVREATQCSKGARAFFIRHDLDWPDFLKNGIDSKKLEATGDAMALKVCEVAENGRK